MVFNHYAKLKRILTDEPEGWSIRRINAPTKAKNFKGETRDFDHYYRLYRQDGTAIKYGKFQQIDRLASALGKDVTDLPVVES